MKKIFSILLFLSTLSFAVTNSIYSISDTLINKGGKGDSTNTILNAEISRGNDTLVSKGKKSGILSISLLPLDDDSISNTKINHKKFLKEDYRNFSDIFSFLPFGFFQDLGHMGQPSEQMFYGLGNGNISYSRDGVLLNNRILNSYNLNKIGVEPMDSIEVAGITKGFLYNVFSNPVSVGMNSRFNFPKRPVTYLKFYQASYDEGFIDVLFHTPITNKLDFGIDVSNSAIDSRFSNSDYESWKINAQLNYNVNDKINIHANYFFSYDTLALFGGLDTNTMLNDNYSTVLYPFDLRTRVSSRYQLTYNNQAVLKIITTIFPEMKTDLTFFVNSNSQMFRQNIDSSFSNLPVINDDNNQFTYGVSLRNYSFNELYSLDVIANYESTTFNTDILNNNSSQNIFSLSGDLKVLKSFKYFVPSLFGKFSEFDGTNLFGFGVNVTGSISDKFNYFVGASKFQQQVSRIQNTIHDTVVNNLIRLSYNPLTPSENTSFEMGIKYNSNLLNARLSYFRYSATNSAVGEIVQYSDSLLINEVCFFSGRELTNSGFNLNISFMIWRFLFEDNISYFFNSDAERLYSSPQLSLAGKFYYLDNLFNNNLELKAGINYRFASGQTPFVYDFEKLVQSNRGLTNMVSYSQTSSTLQLDLFLAGTIQKRATIFVTLENILDSEYYIVPYYFKQSLSLRFGVSWLLFD